MSRFFDEITNSFIRINVKIVFDEPFKSSHNFCLDLDQQCSKSIANTQTLRSFS